MNLKEAINKTYRQRWQHNKDGLKSCRRAEKAGEFLGLERDLEDFTNEDFEELHEYLFTTKGLKSSTVNRYSASVRMVFRLAYRRWHSIDRMPHIERYKEPKGRIRYLSYEEEDKLLELAERDYSHLFAFLLDTGMRFSEAVRLKRDDVDFHNGLISVWETKGDLPRSVPMTDRVEYILRQRPFLFKGMEYYCVRKEWERCRTEMGLEDDDDFVIHILRHTCASRLVQKGVDLYSVKEILGHSSIKVTEKYAHLNPERLKDAISVLNER